MKTRTAFALALCLVSSLALADNPSDAPLVTDNEGSAVVQQNETAGCTQDHRNKKDASLSQRASKNHSTSRQKKALRNSEVPAKTNASATL
jgi:hypothetical protein